VRRLLVDVRERDLRARFRELEGERAPDARTCTRDGRDLAFEGLHHRSLSHGLVSVATRNAERWYPWLCERTHAGRARGFWASCCSLAAERPTTGPEGLPTVRAARAVSCPSPRA